MDGMEGMTSTERFGEDSSSFSRLSLPSTNQEGIRGLLLTHPSSTGGRSKHCNSLPPKSVEKLDVQFNM